MICFCLDTRRCQIEVQVESRRRPKLKVISYLVKSGTVSINSCVFTPSYKKTILGSKQPVSGIKFFCRFSLRLSENNRSRIMFIAKFGPTASDFGYEILTIFGLRLEPSCDHTFGAGLDLTCPSFRGLNSDDFPFLFPL